MSAVASSASSTSTSEYRRSWRDRLGEYVPQIVLAPWVFTSFVYVFGFTAWTFYISLSNSTQLPTYEYQGFGHYVSLWKNARWNIAYTNLFVFGVLFVA